MPTLTAETGIPEEVLSGWRSEYGHKAEESFETVLEKLGVEPLKEKPDPTKAEKLVAEGRIAAMRSSPKEDFEKGIDFHFFNPLTGKLVPVDISVSKDPTIHASKRERDRNEGVRFLPLSARTLELARMGGERDLKEIWQSVNVLLLSDALDQAKSGEVQIPQAKLARIEQRLDALTNR
ncbi:MAG: hypothetical protein Q8L46_00865 [candidate division WWE3 bacterium]|nr:hypothetical protein [candidate division WWE3 bacterium]